VDHKVAKEKEAKQDAIMARLTASLNNQRLSLSKRIAQARKSTQDLSKLEQKDTKI
jgi:hypothetical protein